MKNLIMILLITVSIIFTTKPLFTQWVQTSGPYGGPINSIITSQEKIFAGTLGGGVFLSTNSGTTWRAVNTGLRSTLVQALGIMDTNIFVGTYVSSLHSGGIFLSTNNGAGWSELKTGFTNIDVRAFAFLGKDIFAAIHNYGIFRSTDNGSSWNPVNTGLTHILIDALVASGTNLITVSFGNVYLSTNNGTNWIEKVAGNFTIYSLTVSDANVFAAGDLGCIYRSTNNGIDWVYVNSNAYFDANVLAISGKYLFAGTDIGVWRSTDNGTSWTLANTGLERAEVCSFANSGTNLFAGTLWNGIFLSTDSGTSWKDINTGMAYGMIHSFAVSDKNLYAGTEGGIFSSTDNGTTWRNCTNWSNVLPSPFKHTTFYTLIFSDSNLFAGTDKGLFSSTINGTNWSYNDLFFGHTPISFAISGFNIFTACNYSICISSNNGESWNPTNSFGSDKITSLAVASTNLFAGTSGDGLFHSTDYGTSWKAINSGLTSLNVSSLAVSGSNLFAGTVDGVFFSTNNGTNWTKVSTGSVNSNHIISLSVSGSYLFAESSQDVYLFTNEGTGWTKISEGLPEYPDWLMLTTLTVCDSNLFAGTYGKGVWRRTLSEMVTSMKGSSELPIQFNLSQNFPNPFNPSTTISFSLPIKSYISLKIYDFVGREVTTLIRGEMNAGRYTQQWNAERYASGVYFYRLHARSFVETKKMILMR